MAFEMKILDKIRCPRCNAMAELRIDQREPNGNWIFVYIVCPICRLNRYSHVTTRKVAKIQAKINNLKKTEPKTKKIYDRLEKIEKIKARAEKNF